ncbi:MAG TPA: alpha-xylosidase, partial [Paludibacter sp.]|nr:alpha-xylosidase [Paludibacter sp.]
MTRYKLIVLFSFLISLSLYSSNTYQKNVDGIQISLKQKSSAAVKIIRLQVITDDIIRVSATPATKLPSITSLITTYGNTMQKGWTATQNDDYVILKTATTKAIVSTKTGEIKFTDLNGKTILQEQKNGGKTFSAITVEGKSGYTFRQVFESPADEA